jgi:ABC-type Zn uptake system ZnuABC Zn-binding protein ZnuA
MRVLAFWGALLGACAAALPLSEQALAQKPTADVAGQREVTVLTALPAIYSIASSLAQGTRIRVVNVSADGRPMNALGRYLEKPGVEVVELLRKADAVVTIGKLWHQDPLFAAARAQNIRVVNIDATEPYSATMPGIALVRQPSGQAPWQKGAGSASGEGGEASPYFWLAPSNGARAAEIVASDFARLAPQDAQQIAQNLAAFRQKLLALKQSAEAKLAEADNVTVFALTSDFAYLTTDLGLFVDGYFLRQDIEWTPDDLAAFQKHLSARGIRVVIHKWEPSQAIEQAVKSAGATLVVLRSGESFAMEGGASREEAYLADVQMNLTALRSAFNKPDASLP